jgi:putative oxidoreductase
MKAMDVVFVRMAPSYVRTTEDVIGLVDKCHGPGSAAPPQAFKFAPRTTVRMLLNSEPIAEDLGKLVLRLGAGGLMFWYHGLPKVLDFSEKMSRFEDPFGISGSVAFILIVFAETVCALLVALGLWTRAATLPLIVGMAVAAFIRHGDEPFAQKEKAVLFLLGYVVVLLAGSGRFCLDRISFR